MLNGIDVANVNGTVDWPGWRGRIQFAGIKVSEGVTFTDGLARANIAGARSISAVPMAYHFLHASVPGQAQAAYFLARCKAAGLERGDLLAVDAEQGGQDGLSPAELWAVATDFAAAVHAHFGCWPVCYTDISLAAAAPSPAGQCPLWLANPSRVPTAGGIGPWRVVSFEQTGQSGTDLDVFYGDAAALRALAIPPAPAAAPAPSRPTRDEAAAALGVLTRYVG